MTQGLPDETLEDVVEWVSQWAKTLCFGAELPLPVPLQCDAVPVSGVFHRV